ncbi:hypothetical protein AAEP93_011276 [Penicillium crustosum]
MRAPRINTRCFWAFRFNAPSISSSFNGSYPLAPVTHSSENTYLNYLLSTMTDYERAIADEFRAYWTFAPATQTRTRLQLLPHYGSLSDLMNSPVCLGPQFAFESNANKSYPTSTQFEVCQKTGLGGQNAGPDLILDQLHLQQWP